MVARRRGAAHVSSGFDAELAFLLVVVCLLTVLLGLRG